VPFLIAMNFISIYAARSSLIDKRLLPAQLNQENISVSNTGHLGGFLTGFMMYLLAPIK
jgi:membrane associated rhomboid family serine protease